MSKPMALWQKWAITSPLRLIKTCESHAKAFFCPHPAQEIYRLLRPYSVLHLIETHRVIFGVAVWLSSEIQWSSSMEPQAEHHRCELCAFCLSHCGKNSPGFRRPKLRLQFCLRIASVMESCGRLREDKWYRGRVRNSAKTGLERLGLVSSMLKRLSCKWTF